MQCLAGGLAAPQWKGKDIIGVCPSIEQLAGHYERLSGRQKRLRVRLRNFQLNRVTRPPAAPGVLHCATAADRVALGRFLQEFDAFLGEPIEEDYQARADRIIGEGRAYLWMDGEPVSMASSRRSLIGRRKPRRPGAAGVAQFCTCPSGIAEV